MTRQVKPLFAAALPLLLLLGCGGQSLSVEQRTAHLKQAPETLLGLDLPGCPCDTGLPGEGTFTLQRHPLADDLLVVFRDTVPVCVDAANNFDLLSGEAEITAADAVGGGEPLNEDGFREDRREASHQGEDPPQETNSSPGPRVEVVAMQDRPEDDPIPVPHPVDQLQ